MDNTPFDPGRRACDALRAAAEIHEGHLGADSLYVFLSIHECICRRVAKSGTSSLIRLNDGFVAACVETHRIFQEGRWSDLHPAWVWPYNAYMDNRFNHSFNLPLMAAAHIIGDLELVLARLCCATKEEYDSVFQDIITCAEDVGESFSVYNTTGKTYFNWYFYIRNRMTPGDSISRPSLGRGARLVLALSSIPQLRGFAIRKMREYAWKTAQTRKNLKTLW